MKTITIRYHGADLEIAECLKDIWPFEISLVLWPTFCGAGVGMGDWLIPENICSIDCSCCCFDHDVSWILSKNTFADFMRANLRFYLNLRNLVIANSKKHRIWIELKCFIYFIAVCTAGWKAFSGMGPIENALIHPAVKAKIDRLREKLLRG